MIKDFFASEFKKPEILPLSRAELKSVVDFCTPAFGFSEWIAHHGELKQYYFNLDKSYAEGDRKKTAKFHRKLIKVIKNVAKAKEFRFLLKEAPPVLAYVCPESAPAGIIQARGVLSESLGWPSVIVSPYKRLLRARVIAGDGKKNFPESVEWLAGRHSFILADAATTGESIAAAAGALRAFGVKTLGAAVVYNRDEGAGDSLETVGIPLYSLLEPASVKQENVDLSELIKVGSKEVRDFSYVMAKAG